MWRTPAWARNAQSLGNGIGRLEANSVNIKCEPIRIFAHPFDRLVTVSLVDANRPGCPHPVGLEKDHDLPDHLLFGPSLGDAFFTLGADTFEFEESFRSLLNDVEHGFPKRPDQFPGKVGTDPFNHPGAQVFFNTFQRTRWDDSKLLCPELQPVLTIVLPAALTFDILACSDNGGGPHHGHQITLATNLDPQHAKSTLLTVESDALH